MRQPKSLSHHHESLVFPKNFLWGTATSSHQVEGNNLNNDWWQWEQRGRVHGHQKSGLACDQYFRYEKDFDFISQMHNNAYRLSVEWSRVQPAPDGWDYSEIKHYRAVLQSLRDRQLSTIVTLHHFTNPIWFASQGGWAVTHSVNIFSKYVEFVARELGDLVDFWVSINEPTIYAIKGYYEGSWPPGKRQFWQVLKVLSNFEQAHINVYKILHNGLPQAKVGLAHNMFSYQLYRPENQWDRLFMDWLNRFWNHRFLRRTRGFYDFIGLNYYFHYRLKKFNFRFKQFFTDPRDEEREISDLGWEVFPPGITQVLLELKRYQVPIYITENGIATSNDDRRVRYLISYLKEVYGAIRAGVDVRGYFYWSLLDNFEWEKGFGPRFGLVEVDFETQKRTLRPSGKLYARIASENAIAHDLLRYLGHSQKVKAG